MSKADNEFLDELDSLRIQLDDLANSWEFYKNIEIVKTLRAESEKLEGLKDFILTPGKSTRVLDYIENLHISKKILVSFQKLLSDLEAEIENKSTIL